MSAVVTAPSRPLGPWANGMIMSEEEFDSRTDYDPCYRYELLHGVLIVSPPPDFGERRPNDEFAFLFGLYKQQHPQNCALDDSVSEQTLHTSAGRRRADRVVWTGLGRQPDPDRDIPSIVIEFVSDSTRDRQRDYETKRAEYLEIGVQEYWVIDRFRRTMTVFRKAEKRTIAERETYRTDLLPGLELTPARLFAVAEGRPLPE